MILALAALLCIPSQPASTGGLGQVRAQVRATALPVLRERAQDLSHRIEDSELHFRAALLDLDGMDIPRAALGLDRQLCLIVDEALRLEALAGVRDNALVGLVEIVLDDARRARARMESVEALGSTAHSYLRLLGEMRTARRRGELDRVLTLYKERRSNSLPEQWAQPVRRILVALDELRVEVITECRPLVRPRVRPQ